MHTLGASFLFFVMRSSLAMRNNGFTLIELSIVLVIIGLVIGGVLVGKELITTAAITKQMAQIREYTAAVNTFRTKYNYLPGDLPASQADQLGFITRSGEQGSGDGNGKIEYNTTIHGNGGYVDGSVLQGELVSFWTDLSSAGLVKGSFTELGDAYTSCIIGFCAAPGFARWLPTGTLRDSDFVVAYHNFSTTTGIPDYSGLLFEIISIYYIGGPGQVVTNPAMTVAEAYRIDSKIDDGAPLTGRVISSMPAIVGAQNYIGYNSESGWWTGHGSDETYCVADTTPLSYNLNFPDSIACSLMMAVNL